MAKSSKKKVDLNAYKENKRFSSIEGLVESEQSESLQEADRLFHEGQLLNFKKHYNAALENYERAHAIYSKKKNFIGAIQCLVEMAWIKYNHGESDGITKANHLFGDAQKMIDAHINAPGANEVRARLLHYRGLVKYREGVYGEGIKLFKQAQTYCWPDGLEAAKLNDSFAVYYERIGDFQRAIQSLKSAMRIKQNIGSIWEQAVTLQILGRVYMSQSDYTQAFNYLEASLKLSEELEDTRRVASLKNELIKLHIYQQDLDGAGHLIEEAESEHKESAYPAIYGVTLFYKSYLCFLRKEYPRCEQLLNNEVVPLLKRHNYLSGLGKAKRLLASVESYEGKTSQAPETMGEAFAIFKETNEVDELAKSHFEMGKIYLHMNQESLALASFLETLKIAELNGIRYLMSYVEDEIYKIDRLQWQDIVDKRANHERTFEKERTLLEALSALSEESATSEQLGDSESESETKINGPLLKTNSLVSLLRVGQAMAGERDLDKLLALIMEETETALNADRCTVFLYDRETNELWSKKASGLNTDGEIRFPAHLGLAGYVCKTGDTLNIKNAYEDPRFNKEVDKKTGYKTENLLCMPMRNRKMEIIGVFQVLNKRDGAFEKTDEDLLMAIAASAGVALENAKLATDQKIAFESFIKTLSTTIDARDPITAGHSERVAEYSILLGQEMQMSGEEIEALAYASLLHDIGKIGIREDILLKDGRLTEKEYRHIQKHAYYTYEILKNIHFDRHLKDVPEIAASHHEKMDGTGYFRGLKGSDIPFSGRILALSDVFDAITSRRHYRNRMPFERVLSILKRDAESHFDPDCVNAFFNVKLFDLGRVLLLEHRYDLEDTGEMIQELDKRISVAEYEEILNKHSMTKAEADIHRNFSAIYHRGLLSDLD